MASPFRDNTYLWVVWHRGRQQSDVVSVEGLYRGREEALFQASKVNAEGLTPIKDRILANMFKVQMPTLLERDIPRD
ncbi:MAG: hypothetical protein EOO38_00225 [Cytophagaceae bacterium]|nr:MAG: hypothetical protein EOO38_00225 [Cytophagaceae bacterium]